MWRSGAHQGPVTTIKVNSELSTNFSVLTTEVQNTSGSSSHLGPPGLIAHFLQNQPTCVSVLFTITQDYQWVYTFIKSRSGTIFTLFHRWLNLTSIGQLKFIWNIRLFKNLLHLKYQWTFMNFIFSLDWGLYEDSQHLLVVKPLSSLKLCDIDNW